MTNASSTPSTIITPEELGLKQAPMATVLDLGEISLIMRRHAMAAALVSLMRTRWVPEKDLVLRIFSWGEPGLVEVDVPKRDVWRIKAESIFNSHLTRFERLCSNVDAAGIFDFVQQQKTATQRYKQETAKTFNEVSQLNRDIGQEMGWTVDKLFAIKTGASVVFYGALTLSGLGFVAGALAGSGFSLSTQFAMTRSQATQSSILAFTSMSPAFGAVAAKAVVNGAGSGLVNTQKSALRSLKLNLAFDAAKASQLRANPLLGVETPRSLPRNFKGGPARPSMGQAKFAVAGAQAAAQAAGFAVSIYFLKDDIVRAMNGYSRSHP